MSNNGNNAKRATIGGVIDNDNANLLDKFFEIPPYQRLYEWEKDEIKTLLDDIKKAFETNKEKEYFIGTITTSVDKDNNDKFVLIDGQQRLTTIWFIGFYLASRGCTNWQDFIIQKQDDKLRIAMPIRDNEENALKELTKNINGKESLAQLLQTKNIHQKIINAFKCIESWFNENFSKDDNKKEIDFERLNCFANFIYTKVCFVFVTLAENTDLNRFFVRMNNRGKQLEKHEILKARLLDKIKDDKSDEWQKYAKIWDLCSDMDKYIFQSASDRSIFAPKSQDNNGTKSINDNDSLVVKLADIVEKYKIPEANKSKEKDSPSKVESIIDFPTFLLHCYKLWVAKKCSENEIPKEVTITKDKLLEIMWDAKDERNKHDYLLIKRDKQDCKEFIIDILRYRVLFDYFVIKNTLGDDGFAIMRFYKSNGSYQAKAKSFENLAMIQNYLRVARQGEKQNYEHWLTNFLEFLDDDNPQFDEIKEIKEFVDKFLSNKDKNELPKSLVKKESQKDEPLTKLQEKLVEHLEKVDTEQIYKVNIKDKELEDISMEFLKEYLSNGTNTPHYWFYRLEYYLWKWGKDDDGKNLVMFENEKSKIYNTELGESKNKVAFKDIFTKNLFHFRILGSIEHFSAIERKNKRQNEWNLNIFGNLALISQNLNSSLSNELENCKKDKVIEQLKRGRLESLKYFIMCANLNQDEWTEGDAQAHQKQMINILIESLSINPKDS